jgi:branched-chain amino acid aminotransferase
MNLYFVYGSGDNARLVTPELTGALLPGVTRDSILQVASDLGVDAEAERISVDDWRQGNADGSITEVFACGTAAVITPVGQVRWREGGWAVGDGGSGPLTMKLRERLLDIQHGRRDDTHNWMHALVDA